MPSKWLARDEAELRDYQSIAIGWPTGDTQEIRSHRYRGRRNQPPGRHRTTTQHHWMRNTVALALALLIFGVTGLEPMTTRQPSPSPAYALDNDRSTRDLRASRNDAEDQPKEPKKVAPSAAPRAVKKAPVRVASSQAEAVVQYALAQVGKPYRWGAAGPSSFDCSGLVMAAYASVGIKLPHYTGTILNYGRTVSKSELRRGDIIFPQSGHAGIFLGDGKMVHASSSQGGVGVSSIYNYWTGRTLL